MASFALPAGYPAMPSLQPGPATLALHWHERIRQGIPASLFYEMSVPGLLPRPALAQVVFGDAPAPRSKAKLLEVEQANVLYRVLQVLAGASAVFKGDTKLAVAWLVSPRPELRGRVPLALCGTSMGLEYVRTALGRIAG